MSEWSETVKIGFVLVIIAVVINIIFGAAVMLQKNNGDINQNAVNTVQSNESKEFIKYDGIIVTGAQAAAFIEKHYPARDVGVIVNNGVDIQNYIKGIKINGNIAEFDESAAVSQSGKISDESENNYYIKPSDAYLSKVYKNKYDAITCIGFEKC